MTYFINPQRLDLVICNFFIINAVDEDSYKSFYIPGYLFSRLTSDSIIKGYNFLKEY